MPWSIFTDCGDSCGWTAAAISALCIGSYGVPIKETMQVEVHPLVLQSYKTLVVFFLFGFVLLLGERIRWTNWGLVSGFLWVLGGSVGIHAIRTAGMAIATGTWASVTVMMNFIWGILIFHEPVQNFTSTCCAFCLLGLGLVGMSRYSDPSASISGSSNPFTSSVGGGNLNDITSSRSSSYANLRDVLAAEECIELIASNSHEDQVIIATSTKVSGTKPKMDRKKAVRKRLLDDTTTTGAPTNNDDGGVDSTKADDAVSNRLVLPLIQQQQQQLQHHQRQGTKSLANKDRIVLFGRWALTRRQLGILSAVGNGMLAGSSLIPLHYAKKEGFGGATYMISFSVGSLIANCLVWIWFYAYTYWTMDYHRTIVSNSSSSSSISNNPIINSGGVIVGGGGGATAANNTTNSNKKKWYTAWEALPKWHFAQLWMPGFMAGFLLSIGMFGSIMTVTYLGQGIGNSLIQSKILISGLWGICWYKEITARHAIVKWFLSASTAVMGILWLTFEHTSAVKTKSTTGTTKP